MDIRKPAVAGQFYPGNSSELRWEVEGFIRNSNVDPAPEKTKAIVSPHAGYVFSGPTAGYVFARVKDKKPKRVILLGCSHRYQLDKACVYSKGAFETPVGTFPIDDEFASTLVTVIDSPEAEIAEPHIQEHCLEVQLPFVEATMGIVPIVPVLFSSPCKDWHKLIGQALADLVDDDDLVIASTDLSHYLSEEEANSIDKRTTDAVLAKDCKAVSNGINDGSLSMCGSAAVVVAMACALEKYVDKWSLLDYRTSGEASGDYSRVVGYAGISMEEDT